MRGRSLRTLSERQWLHGRVSPEELDIHGICSWDMFMGYVHGIYSWDVLMGCINGIEPA